LFWSFLHGSFVYLKLIEVFENNMNNKIKIFLSLIILILPLLVFADDGQNMKRAKTVFDLLLTSKYIVGFVIALIGIGLIWAKKLDNTMRITFLIIAFFLFRCVCIVSTSDAVLIRFRFTSITGLCNN